MAGEIDTVLRQEIIECQRTRSEFLRWKLILVAGVGAAGLGVGSNHEKIPALLALIPLICVYADSICLHNDSRIMAIAQFFANDISGYVSREARSYERWCQANREHFREEGIVLSLSSGLLSVAVMIYGFWNVVVLFLHWWGLDCKAYACPTVNDFVTFSMLIIIGGACTIKTCCLQEKFESIQKRGQRETSPGAKRSCFGIWRRSPCLPDADGAGGGVSPW